MTTAFSSLQNKVVVGSGGAEASQSHRTYSSSRSSKVIDLGANRKRVSNFLLVIH